MAIQFGKVDANLNVQTRVTQNSAGSFTQLDTVISLIKEAAPYCFFARIVYPQAEVYANENKSMVLFNSSH